MSMTKDVIGMLLREVMQGFNSGSKNIVEYKNIHHIMMKDMEVQNPSKNEMYTFMLRENWKIVNYNNDYITIVKE